MQTSIRVDGASRDELSRIAADDLGGVTLDEALRTVLFHYHTISAIERLESDPEALAEYRREAQLLADVDPEPVEW